MSNINHSEAAISEVLQKVWRLYSQAGYFARFTEICQQYPQNSYKANYHLLEIEFFELFGDYRYKDYSTFRVMKKRHQNILLTKLTPITI